MTILGAILGAAAVASGAFGTHSLKDVLTPERMETWQTAVQYMQWHVLVMLLSGYLHYTTKEAMFKWALGGFLTGTFLFSGSLFILVLTDTPVMGAVAPFGGILLIAAWCLLAVGIKRTF